MLVHPQTCGVTGPTVGAPPPLRVRTVPIPDPGSLLSVLPRRDDVLAWIHRGEGLVGWGRAAVLRPGGPGRFTDAWHGWRELVARAEVTDEVDRPGTGPVAFTSSTFGDDTDDGRSALIVPRVLVGRRGGRAWRTEIGPAQPDRAVAPRRRLQVSGWSEGQVGRDAYRDAVGEAVDRIRSGPLRKVVLARDIVARLAEEADHREVLGALPEDHGCWAFAVDGLIGLTPELLVRRRGTEVASRVLAGTAWPGGPDVLDSAKITEEHSYAVDSVRSTLGPLCDRLDHTPPWPLRLATLTHLASDVAGTLSGGAADARLSVLQLAEALHPTAAVGGAPPGLALDSIAELEGGRGMRRGRYAGPVGWVDADGDGDLGIALRCAQFRGREARLFAGCGIVAGSDPDAELAETTAKFRSVAAVLGIATEHGP